MSSEYQEAMCPPADVLVAEWTWKTPAMKAMTLAVCTLAVERGVRGSFSALDLKTHGASAHGGSGIAGSVFRQLADAGVIAPVGGFIDGEFQQKTVPNEHGNRIGLWKLNSRALALSLLRVHGPVAEELKQLDLFIGGGSAAAPNTHAVTAGL